MIEYIVDFDFIVLFPFTHIDMKFSEKVTKIIFNVSTERLPQQQTINEQFELFWTLPQQKGQNWMRLA